MITEQQKFFEACQSNDIEQVRSMINERKIDINGETGQGKECLTALKVACLNKHMDLIKLLINSGANLNHTGSLGRTALCCVINRTGQNYDEVIDLLLRQNSYITTLNAAGEGTFETVLHYAFVGGQMKIVEKILWHGITSDNYPKPYKEYYRLLLSMINDDLIELRKILSYANVDSFYHLNEENILYYAISLKNRQYIKELLEKGVRPTYGYSRSLFYHTIESDFVDILELFFDYGYQGIERLIKPPNEYKKDSVFTEVLISSHFSRILKLLIEKGDFNVNTDLDADGQKILLKACLLGSTSSIKTLLELNADPNCIHPHSRASALHIAAKYRNLECVKLLVNHGANLRALDKKGRTVLHAAAENRITSHPLKYFLKMKIFDVNCQDLDGNTPLHGIISENGSTIGYFTPSEQPQYHRATPGCNCANFRILLKYGANESIKNSRNETPFYSRDLDDESPHDNCRVLAYFIKLRLLGYKVNENTLLSIHNHQRYNSKVGVVKLYERELVRLKDVVIHFFPKTSLYDILFMKFHKFMRLLNNETLLRIYGDNEKDFRKEFPYYGDFLNKRYRRGLARRELQSSGKNFLIEALGKVLPDPVYEGIFRYVPDKKLKDLEDYDFPDSNVSTDLQDSQVDS